MKDMKRLFSIIMMVLSLIVLSLSTAYASKTTWTVCSGGCDSTTIQGAINYASNGDIVLVYRGTYNEVIDFTGLAIEVTSQSCPEETIIDGTGKGDSVVTFDSSEGNNSILSGFTITNGAPTSTSGGGIYCYSASPTIKHCIITGNSSTGSGGGVYSSGGSPIFKDCDIIYNDADGHGGAFQSSSGSPVFEDCDLSNNVAGGIGGAVYAYGSPTFTDCTINNNLASGNFSKGGAFGFLTNATPTITNCTINNNKSEGAGNNYGGGIWAGSNVSITLENTIITNNETETIGGGICGGFLDINNCTISNNKTTSSYYQGGGGIHINNSSSIITNSIVWGNTAASTSGYDEIYIGASQDLEIYYSDIDESGIGGGGTWNDTEESNIDSDPLFEDDDNENLTLRDYHLTDSSPCIDQASATYAPADDFEGDSRPQNSADDMGADEHYVAP